MVVKGKDGGEEKRRVRKKYIVFRGQLPREEFILTSAPPSSSKRL